MEKDNIQKYMDINRSILKQFVQIHNQVCRNQLMLDLQFSSLQMIICKIDLEAQKIQYPEKVEYFNIEIEKVNSKLNSILEQYRDTMNNMKM